MVGLACLPPVGRSRRVEGRMLGLAGGRQVAWLATLVGRGGQGDRPPRFGSAGDAGRDVDITA